MKKFILLFASIVMIPCILTFLFSQFRDDIQIGTGSQSLENHYIGKDVLVELHGLYKSMDVEEYVLGVLSGTIPADYDMETLKVQAVLIRTNILKEMQEKNTNDAADLSYDYLTVEDRITMWGDRNYENYERRLREAVVNTAGKVIEQEGNLITAFYHEVSVGKTASAQEILGTEISYLQSVESSQDVEAKHYMNIIVYTWEELAENIKAGMQDDDTENDSMQKNEAENNDNVNKASPDQGEIIGSPMEVRVEESTENGFVKKLSVNGVSYTGEEAMEKLKLTSTNFYVEEIDGGVRFVCLGKGNCLGVSQYGANWMAQNGRKMEDIISYYYQGVSIADFSR